MQIPGKNFSDTFAPVSKVNSLLTLLTLLAIAASKKLFIEQLDVNSAYLNADLKEEIYLKLPKKISDPKYN